MEPQVRREGNCRLVSLPVADWPYDYVAALSPVDAALAEAGASVQAQGPALVLVSLPPDDPQVSTWGLHIGRACTGLPTVRAPLLVEDYHQLVSVTVPHHGPVRDLHRSYRLAADFARAQGGRPRPYWRIRLHHSPTPDGQAILTTDVSVFIDR